MRGTGIFIKLVSAAVIASAAAMPSYGHSSDSSRVAHHLGFNVRPSSLLPTHEFFRGKNELGKRLDKSASAHLQYSFAFPESSRFGEVNPTAYQGIGVAFNTFFDRNEIGNPVSVYVFQGASLARLSKSLTLDYEWNFGVSFGWHPYDPDGKINPDRPNTYNLVVGSKVNAYINFGLMLVWSPDSDWSVSAGTDFTHFSNGNTSYPNSGVNTIGLRLGASRRFGQAQTRQATASKVNESEDGTTGRSRFFSRLTYDATIYGAVRVKGLIWNDTPYIPEGKFGIIGLNINPLYRVNKFFRAGFSIDIQYDESANIHNHIAGTDNDGKIRFFRPPIAEQLGAGLSLRAEFVMPVFSVNIGFGRNLIYKGDDLKGFYQSLALKTDLYKGLFLHIGYKLHDFQDPNNLMLGVGWRFGESHPRK